LYENECIQFRKIKAFPMGIFKDKITQLDNMFLDKIKQAAT
jgi:hypothetical protein